MDNLTRSRLASAVEQTTEVRSPVRSMQKKGTCPPISWPNPCQMKSRYLLTVGAGEGNRTRIEKGFNFGISGKNSCDFSNLGHGAALARRGRRHEGGGSISAISGPARRSSLGTPRPKASSSSSRDASRKERARRSSRSGGQASVSTAGRWSRAGQRRKLDSGLRPTWSSRRRSLQLRSRSSGEGPDRLLWGDSCRSQRRQSKTFAPISSNGKIQ
jgi:hypothetical protein